MTESGQSVGLGPGRLFLRDVRRALAACRFDPRLPVVVVGLSLVIGIPGVLGRDGSLSWAWIIGTAISFLTLGVLGAERLWFVAADRRIATPRADVVHFSKLLWRRFFGLGVYMIFMTIIAMLPFLLVGLGVREAVTGGAGNWPVTVAASIAFFVVECGLTFATVALAFTDVPAGDAARLSLRVIRDEWPMSAWYVFAAPLTLQVVAMALPQDSIPLAVRITLVVVIAVVRLCAVGAAALFFADRYVEQSG